MIVIFDIRGGLNDMFKDIIAIIQFVSSSNINYTVRSATLRKLNDPTIFKIYELKNIINEDIFLNDKNYVSFDSIKNDLTNNNTYDFYSLQITKKLWDAKYRVPPIDVLIDKLPFKNNYPIYIATSYISLLNRKNLLQKPVDAYTNILYKYDSESDIAL
jgi:hypothetical protein